MQRGRSDRRVRDGAPVAVPSRLQYLELKALHPEAILLYRMGDFYEAFDDDARVVARDARITLTSRSFGRSGRVPMAGLPHHALNHYLGRLLAAGHTIALAEQMTEPGRGLVERAVARVLTPGTISEPALLPAGENRYLAAVCNVGGRFGLAWVDVSTGEFALAQFDGPTAYSQVAEELARLSPAECLVSDESESEYLPHGCLGTRLERRLFEPERARSALCEHFRTVSLAPYGCADLPAASGAAGAVLSYLARMNPALLPMLTTLRTERDDRYMGLDAATRHNLELTIGLGTRGRSGSLLSVLDRTRTAMGARALRSLVCRPLRDLQALSARQTVVSALVAKPTDRAALSENLAEIGDLERLVGRIVQRSACMRDYLSLATALRVVPGVVRRLHGAELPEYAASLYPCEDVLAQLDAAVATDSDGSARIVAGYLPDLDAALEDVRETRFWLAGLEQHERQRTGIRSLKVGYNKVFGYYIEVTRPNLSLVPSEYTRKQTVATGERYYTAELKVAEARVQTADEHIVALERTALAQVAEEVSTHAEQLLQTARSLASLDALLSLAEVASHRGWAAPTLDEGDALEILCGRHPVVESCLSGEAFIPNNCRLGGDHPRVLLVTGPNMGGKSTYLRQTALIVLLAQIGSFVPAERAHIGLVDRIFTRVGAHDDLAGGASTFMVEMLETAAILHQATRSSLVVLDEVGRGTSTYDGLAIARAVLEDVCSRIGARTLFATHYLELTTLGGELPGVESVHVGALESDGRVIFLYAVRPGAADRAYGVQVARLAGLPPWVADRAEQTLAQLVGEGRDVGAAPSPTRRPGLAEDAAPTYQLELDGVEPGVAPQRVATDLRDLDLDALTPRQALEWLYEQQARLGGPSTATTLVSRAPEIVASDSAGLGREYVDFDGLAEYNAEAAT